MDNTDPVWFAVGPGGWGSGGGEDGHMQQAPEQVDGVITLYVILYQFCCAQLFFLPGPPCIVFQEQPA